MSLRNGNECYHLSSLSVTKDGWVIAAPNNDFAVEFWRASTVGSDAAPAITSSCRKLMKACKVDYDDDLFTEQVDCQGEIANLPEATDNDRSDDDKNSPENPTSANSTPLEYLSHIPDLQNIFMKVISDVRRMGEPSNREKDKEHEQSQPENGISNGGKRSRRNNNRERGKIAQLEEQRRLRLEKQSQSQSEIRSNAQTEQSEQDDQDGDLTLPLDGFNNNLSNKNDENEGFIRVGKNHDIQPSKETMSPGWRLAVTFNSLRIFVSLLRPILDNPHRRDTSLKMKHGPSIKTSGEKHRNYLLSKHVYSCVSNVCWKELRREYVNVLALLNMGVEKMEQQDKASGRYEQSVKDWITSLFDYSQFTCEESLEKKCMDFEVLPSDQGSAILNKTLMDQFSYESGKKQDELKKSIQDLQSKLELAISRKFKGVRLTVYGSCLSGLALQGSHDVDVSIYIPEMYELKQKFDDGINSATSFEKQMRNIVFRVKNCLQYCRSESFDDLFAITRARVPVLKGRDINACNPYSPDGSLSFDLCFLNDIAVVNSSLLREYSLVDNRVRMLMLAVKSFAKKNKIASAADGTLSSYTWLNLVIFYLQCIGFVPNLQCRELMKQHDWHPDPGENPWHCINGLETYYLSTETMTKSGIWKQPDRFANTKIPNLLYGFFNFYAKVFPQQTTAVSIRFGKCTLQKTSLQKTSKIWRLCIEDPFETFDSHCLHDLGCHLDEGGQKKVMNCLAQTRDRLGDLLQQAALDDGLIQSFVDLFETSQKSGAKSNKHQTGQQGQKYSDKSRLASRIQPRRGNNDPNNNGIKQKGNKGSTNTQTTKGPGQNQAVTEGSTRTFVVDIHNNDDDNQHSGGKRHHRIDQRQSKKQNATLAALEQSREKQNVPSTRNKGHRNRYSTKKRPPTNIPAKEMASATIATEGGNVGNGARSTNEDKDTTRQGNEMKNSNSGLQNKYAKKHNHKLSRNQKNNSTVQN